jgi:transcription elongation factor SPT5
MSERDDSLSEDDAVFTDSEGERLDYSGSSSTSEGSDEEEEAVATDEEERPSKRRKRERGAKKAKRNRFVEMEATVGDDDDEDEEDYGRGGSEEEEEEEEEEGDFVDNEIEEREKEFSKTFQKRLEAHAARREAARQAFKEELDPEKVEERLRQLYGRTRMTEGGTATEATLATVLQPKSTDPKLWLVKCRPGRERAAVAALLNGLQILGNDMGVFSVIGRDSLKGFIYVEAHKAQEVMNAVQKTKVNHLIFASPINRPVLVPLSEMADVLAAGTTAPLKDGSVDISSLKVGGWVRVKRGKYTGDLAQVVEIDMDAGLGEGRDCVVRVKLLPRLSFRSGRGGNRERPSARSFDPQEASQYGSVTKARGYWLYNGEAYKDGYLFKDVRASSLAFGDVAPRPDELERFGALSIVDEDAATVVSPGTLAKFSKGEAIVITKGEFQHLTGIVEAEPEGDQVSIRFDDTTAFTEPISVNVKYLGRHIETGDMVRVTSGEHAGKSGMVVSLEGKQAVIFSPIDNQQMTVAVIHLVSAAGDNGNFAVPLPARPAKDATNSLEINDLVTIEGDEGEAGIILRILSEEAHAAVIDTNGQTRKVPLKSLRRVPKPTTHGPVRFDPTVFKSGDRVQFTEAAGSVRPATVLHVFRTHAFLHTIDTGEVISRPLMALSRPVAHPSAALQQRSPSRSSSAPMRHLIGKSITISGAGPYKGYVGIVKDITDTIARVELHTDSRVVNVARDRVITPGETGAPPRTPAWGMGGKTPAWTDSRTPAWGASKTPAWGSSSAKTPAWGSSASSKTPAWGSSASSKTPAWGASASSKTPAWGGQSAKTPAWGASAKTPAWGGSARTPAVGGDGGKTPAWQSATAAQGRASLTTGLPSWAIVDTEVTTKSGSVPGKIVAILPSGKLQLSTGSEPVSANDVIPTAPSKKDSVRLLNDDRATGTVIGLDGPDAVIRVDGTSDFRIVPISSLVKIIR